MHREGIVALQLQQWSREGVAMLRHTYFACLVRSVHSFKFSVSPWTPHASAVWSQIYGNHL